MIERKFINENLKELLIKDYFETDLKKAELSNVNLKKTPLGEKIMVSASKPGIIVGRKGENIKNLTSLMKKKFKLENPQVEIEEVQNHLLDPKIVAEKIATTLEKFGPAKFKSAGHKYLTDIMKAGALGVEILISGKIPSERAKTWRFYDGYLKKSGAQAECGIKRAYTIANLKTGAIGIQVKIMPDDKNLPDKVEFKEEKAEQESEQSTEENKESQESVEAQNQKEGTSEKKEESTQNKEENTEKGSKQEDNSNEDNKTDEDQK